MTLTSVVLLIFRAVKQLKHKAIVPQTTRVFVIVDLCVYNYRKTAFTNNKMQKQAREAHIICQAAGSKPLHLAKTCSKESRARKAYKGTQKEVEEWVGSHSQAKMVLLAGPDTQSRNAFKQSKRRKIKKGEEERRGREGGRRRGGMRAEGICASL